MRKPQFGLGATNRQRPDGQITVKNALGSPFRIGDQQAEHPFRRVAEGLAAGDGHLREILDALPAAIYVTDSAGYITYYNEAAAAFWGHHPETGNSQWCGSRKLYTADGKPLPHDQCPMATTVREMRVTRGAELIAERPDGSRVPFMPLPTLLCDAYPCKDRRRRICRPIRVADRAARAAGCRARP
jgi:PAS domain S-box-containing protein